MPLQYSGIVDEHLTVRASVGLFDVSHMGEIEIQGQGALRFVNHCVTNDVSKIAPGRAQYGFLLNHDGGVIDDIIVYRRAEDEFLICVNASNAEKDFDWLCLIGSEWKGENFHLKNRSNAYAQLAIQGPRASEVAALVFKTAGIDFSHGHFAPFSFKEAERGIIARTGYSGEDGFEIFCSQEEAAPLWQSFLTAGARFGIKPIGLGARDTLRLEACLPLYGHELRDDLSPLCTDYRWAVKLEKGDFVGRKALVAEKANGIRHRLIGLEVKDEGIVREGAKLFYEDVEVGWVTSGTKPPTVKKAIALAYVPPERANVGERLAAEVRGKKLSVEVVSTPFYKRPR